MREAPGRPASQRAIKEQDAGARVRMPCAVPERPAYTSPHSLRTRRGDTCKAGETPSPGRVVIGEPAKETVNFKYIFYSVCSVHKE